MTDRPIRQSEAGRPRSFFASIAGDAADQAGLVPYRLRTVRIGLQATFLAAAALISYLVLPGRMDLNLTLYTALIVATIGGGVLIQVLPWQKLFDLNWGIAAMFTWSVFDIALISVLISATGGYRSTIFLLYGLTTLFFAASYPVRGQVVLTTVTFAGYLIAAYTSGAPVPLADTFLKLTSLGILAFMACFLASELMNQTEAHFEAAEESERRSNLLAVVARASRRISTLSPSEVLEAVVDAALELDFDGATLAVLDDGHETYRPSHSRGLPPEYANGRVPVSVGLVGVVLKEQRTVVVNDYASSPIALPVLSALGFKVAIASPIRTGSEITAVLIAGGKTDKQITPQDVETFELLAAQAERALENASRFQELERTTAELRATTEEREQAEEDKRRLEEQLRQSQKLEAVGMLAGGIAHDFNNLLSVIQNYTAFVHSTLEEDDPNREDLDEVLAASDRGAALVRQLLTFSRREVVRPQVIDLNLLVAEMKKMLETTLTAAISVNMNFADELGTVELDPAQAQQILMNFAVNARDAMPNGGSFVVSTKNVTLDGTFDFDEECEPGPYVCLEVSDTGGGMPDAIKTRIFEPFFTTKDRGAGTGLGLSTVYGIVRQAGGQVTVYSEIGTGTTFRVYLPLCDEESAAQPAFGPPNHEGAGERVLVAEDEEAICQIVRRILTANGYDATVMSAPLDALEAARQGPFDILVTDVVMPKMSGKQLADAVRELQPEIKVLFTSGYAEGLVAEQGVLAETETLLQKPFATHDLLFAIRRLLDEPAKHPHPIP